MSESSDERRRVRRRASRCPPAPKSYGVASGVIFALATLIFACANDGKPGGNDTDTGSDADTDSDTDSDSDTDADGDWAPPIGIPEPAFEDHFQSAAVPDIGLRVTTRVK